MTGTIKVGIFYRHGQEVLCSEYPVNVPAKWLSKKDHLLTIALAKYIERLYKKSIK